MPHPNPIPAWAQSIIGMTLGAIIAVATIAAGVRQMHATIYHWLAIFLTLWVAIFFALKRGLTILVTAAGLTGGAVILFAQHYFS